MSVSRRYWMCWASDTSPLYAIRVFSPTGKIRWTSLNRARLPKLAINVKAALEKLFLRDEVSYQDCQQLVRCHLYTSFQVHWYPRFSDFVCVEPERHAMVQWRGEMMA